MANVTIALTDEESSMLTRLAAAGIGAVQPDPVSPPVNVTPEELAAQVLTRYIANKVQVYQARRWDKLTPTERDEALDSVSAAPTR